MNETKSQTEEKSDSQREERLDSQQKFKKREVKTVRIQKEEYEKLIEKAKLADEYLDDLKRVQAEYINYKKQQERRMQEFVKYSNEELIKELLVVIDNLDRALQNSKDSDNELIKGVELTRRLFFSVLEKRGLREIEAKGAVFDPNFHQAVGSIDSEDDKEGIIVEELQKGYILNDRVIRPSFVIISKKGGGSDEESSRD